MKTRLMIAAANNNFNDVIKYLNQGDSINAREGLFGQTALICALKSNHVQMAKLLVAYGANPNIRDGNGFNAFDILDGTYDQFLNEQFLRQQEEESKPVWAGDDYLKGDLGWGW